MKITPKKANEGVGFTYHVTEEQIRKHQHFLLTKYFKWLHNTHEFLDAIQLLKKRSV